MVMLTHKHFTTKGKIMQRKKNLIDPETTIFHGGKHKGETVESVGEHDPQYLYYLRDSAR